MNRISRLSVPFLSLLLMAACLESCGTSDAKSETAKEKAAAIPALAAFTLTKSSMSSSMQIPGELQAFQQVDLYAKVSSFVKKLYVDVGTEVTAGQLLATMEAPEINAQVSGADSRLKSQEAIYLASKATYDRLLQTSKTPGTVSQNDLDLAFAKQKSDQAQLDAARASHREVSDTRNYLEIRAPFSGVITSRNVSAGAYVGPSGKGSDQPMFTLQEQQKLRLVVSVPEAYAAYLSKESEVSFTVHSLANRQFSAKVSRLAGALDTRLRAQRTEMDVINNERELLPGMIAEVSLPLNSKATGFVLPSAAVLHGTEGVFVIRVQDNKTVWVPVTTGRTDDDKTEVFGNLQEGDILVQRASEEIRNGNAAGKVKIGQPQ